MPNLLALDLSGKTGFAVMMRGRPPIFGTFPVPWEPVGQYARRYSALRAWLVDMDQVHQLDGIAFEAPIKKPTDTMHVIRLLTGYAVVVEEFAGTIQRIPGRKAFDICEVSVQTVKKALTGDAYADKKMMIAAASRRGWKVADDHQADAGAVGLVGYETLWPKEKAA